MIRNFDKFFDGSVAIRTRLSTVPHFEFSTSTETFDAETSVETVEQMTSTEIILEMLANESHYIQQLTLAIQTYLTHDNATITETMKGTITKIFAIIQQIRDFHENTFSKYLSECKMDVTKVASVFIKFTQV